MKLSLPKKSATNPPSVNDDAAQIMHHVSGVMAENLSPAYFALAGIDWMTHLFMSTTKLSHLFEDMIAGQLALSHVASPEDNNYSEAAAIIDKLPHDHRFQSDGWQQWPFNRYYQGFLMAEEWWKDATTNVPGVSKHHEEIVSFIARQFFDACAPSNYPPFNPDIIKATIDEAGQNFIRGLGYFQDDLNRTIEDKLPAGTEQFKLGKNLAATPGKIVLRNRLIELIQYQPTTKETFAEPILIIPAWIMKYYILDLSATNSMVKYLVDKGHTVFMISWKNPVAEDRELGMDDYLNLGINEAINAVSSIVPHQKIHMAGYCLGGTLLAIAAAAMAHEQSDRIKTMTLLAGQTDFTEAGELRLFIDENQIAALEDTMWRQGYLDKNQMANAFKMLHSNELVWSRVVNDYMQGKRSSLNDLMTWNADATRMPARMHSEYLRRLYLNNDLAEGRFVANGKAVSLKDIRVPMFAVGTVTDYVAPWKSVYKIHFLTSSDITFVLTSGGHNAGIISEPGHKGRSYQMHMSPHKAQYLSIEEWQQQAKRYEGSWWEQWQKWLGDYSSGKQKPPAIGSSRYPALGDAPGHYVMEK